MKRVAGLLVCVMPAGAALAHDLWLSPLPMRVAAPATVEVGLRLGELGKVEAMQFDPQRVERLWVVVAGAAREIDLAAPAASVRVAIESGAAHTVAYTSQAASSELPGAKFDAYLAEEHLESILAARKRHADPAAVVAESYSRSLKALVGIDGKALVDCAVGLPLELTLQPAASGRLAVRATLDGKPLPGVWIDLATAQSRVLSEGTSDAEGRVEFDAPAGAAVVRATHMQASTQAGAEWRSWWASTSFALDGNGVAACPSP